MTKRELRNCYKAQRMDLSWPNIEKLTDLLLIRFQQLDIDIPNLIMTYAPMEKFKEFNPQLITDYCYFKNPQQQLFYPVMTTENGSCAIKSVIVDDDTNFQSNSWGIDEPVDGLDMFATEIDLVIVPLLCFDKKGYRVGYGKGLYDRFLRKCRKDCIKIGFSFFEPVEKIEDADQFDVRLDFCVTPERNYHF